MRIPRPIVGASLLALLLAACASSKTAAPTTTEKPATTTAAPAPTATSPTSVEPISGDVVVFAASSLTESFNEIGTAFHTAHPAAKVTFNFGASSALVAQLGQGAPADVFASADTANMTKLTSAGGALGQPVTFATNKLAIIVAKGNPKRIAGLTDLAKPGLVVVLAAPEVPAGRYAQQALDKAGAKVTAKSLEADVKSVVSKVTLGEADAGIVYATDVKAAAGKADGVAIADDLNVVATYPIVVTKAAKNPSAAAAYVAFVTGTDGQTVLSKYGFTNG